MQGFDNAPFAPGYVSVPAKASSTPVMFLVDTGNSKTAISESDATKLGFEPRRLPTLSTRTLGVGGRGNVRVLPGPVLACLIDADNHFHEVELDEIPVLLAFHETERSGGRTRKSNYPYPALLGRDFLSRLDCVLHFDFKKWDMCIEL